MKQFRTHDRYTRSAVHAALFVVLLLFAACVFTGCGELEVLQEWAGDSENAGGAESGRKVLIEDVPEWSGAPYIEINGNVPEFTRREIRRAKKAARKGRRYELLTELDHRRRCGSVTAVVTPETMPTGERGTIGMIRPSGWQLDKYDFIDNGGYLYNRCHLIGWQLTGLNDEERNLITGTRYLNVEGMLPFENRVAEYVRGPDQGSSGEGYASGAENAGSSGEGYASGAENAGSAGNAGGAGAKVLYRATPVFRGKELVARGVQLEAYSLDDNGKSLSFNVYCYNVQPGVSINYRNGKNKLDPATLPIESSQGTAGQVDSGNSDAKTSDAGSSDDETGSASGGTKKEYPPIDIPDGVTYILNTNTMRFHRLDCKGARTILEHNREWFYGTRKDAIAAGYVPCGMCEP